MVTLEGDVAAMGSNIICLLYAHSPSSYVAIWIVSVSYVLATLPVELLQYMYILGTVCECAYGEEISITFVLLWNDFELGSHWLNKLRVEMIKGFSCRELDTATYCANVSVGCSKRPQHPTEMLAR